MKLNFVLYLCSISFKKFTHTMSDYVKFETMKQIKYPNVLTNSNSIWFTNESQLCFFSQQRSTSDYIISKLNLNECPDQFTINKQCKFTLSNLNQSYISFSLDMLLKGDYGLFGKRTLIVPSNDDEIRICAIHTYNSIITFKIDDMSRTLVKCKRVSLLNDYCFISMNCSKGKFHLFFRSGRINYNESQMLHLVYDYTKDGECDIFSKIKIIHRSEQLFFSNKSMLLNMEYVLRKKKAFRMPKSYAIIRIFNHVINSWITSEVDISAIDYSTSHNIKFVSCIINKSNDLILVERQGNLYLLSLKIMKIRKVYINLYTGCCDDKYRIPRKLPHLYQALKIGDPDKDRLIVQGYINLIFKEFEISDTFYYPPFYLMEIFNSYVAIERLIVIHSILNPSHKKCCGIFKIDMDTIYANL